MHILWQPGWYKLLVALLLLSACASAPIPSTIIRTLHNTSPDVPTFSNLLIVSVAGDFESRALFERLFATALTDAAGRATAYHTVIGRRPLLTRATLDTAIASRGFDAVLLVRQKGQERAELAPGRPVAGALDLFGYDYPEFNGGASIEQAPAITFVSELYFVAERRKVWSIDSLSFDKTTATELINEQVAMIALQFRKDKLLP